MLLAAIIAWSKKMALAEPLGIIGSAGLGLVWGWLLVLLGEGTERPWRVGGALAGATFLAGGLVVWLGNGRWLIPFALALILAAAIHLNLGRVVR